jgi:2-dehydro-3-deoxygluconokinase
MNIASPTNHLQPRYDLLALGEVMLRLDPGDQRVRSTRMFQVWEGGGEYNVARGLRTCFGLKTGILTSLVDNDIGRLIESLIMQAGVDTSSILWREFDGIGASARNGLNFTERGFGFREPLGVSDRGHSAASQLSEKDMDALWHRIFAQDGTRWFHTGGIFASLAENTLLCTQKAMALAKKHGATVSYDLNYRPSLWKNRGGIAKAREVNRFLAPYVDVMIGNEGHFSQVLCDDLQLKKSLSDKDYDDVWLERLGEKVTSDFPNLKAVAITKRKTIHTSLNKWSGALLTGGEWYLHDPYPEVPIYDRVGGGDGFSSGLIYGLLHEMPPAKALAFGVAHGALAMTTPGDHSMVTCKEVERLIEGIHFPMER